MWATSQYIQEQAHVLSAQRFEGNFADIFLPQYRRGHGDEDLTRHSLKAAEFLIDLFSSAWQTIGQTAKIPKGKRKYQVRELQCKHYLSKILIYIMSHYRSYTLTLPFPPCFSISTFVSKK